MLIRTLTCLFVGSIVGALGASDARGNEQDAKPDVDFSKFEELMKQFATPGKQHEHFKRLAGAWKCDMTSWYENPNEPSSSKGRAKFTLLMDGRYLRQELTSKHEGQTFQGMGIMGYDNAKKKYVGIWFDNHGTGFMHVEGEYDVNTHTMTEHGVASSPLGDLKFKMVSQYKSNDRFLFTMYAQKPDGDAKMMEIIYTRTQAPRAAAGKP